MVRGCLGFSKRPNAGVGFFHAAGEGMKVVRYGHAHIHQAFETLFGLLPELRETFIRLLGGSLPFCLRLQDELDDPFYVREKNLPR